MDTQGCRWTLKDVGGHRKHKRGAYEYLFQFVVLQRTDALSPSACGMLSSETTPSCNSVARVIHDTGKVFTTTYVTTGNILQRVHAGLRRLEVSRIRFRLFHSAVIHLTAFSRMTAVDACFNTNFSEPCEICITTETVGFRHRAKAKCKRRGTLNVHLNGQAPLTSSEAGHRRARGMKWPISPISGRVVVSRRPLRNFGKSSHPAAENFNETGRERFQKSIGVTVCVGSLLHIIQGKLSDNI